MKVFFKALYESFIIAAISINSFLGVTGNLGYYLGLFIGGFKDDEI